MFNPIFSRSDFHLCEVPVPKGYQQSQTHSGIFYYKGKYYLTSTPFPLMSYAPLVNYIRVIVSKLSFGLLVDLYKAESQENACFYVGDNNTLPPIVFTPVGSNPIVEKPKSSNGLRAYNSDPDLYIENDTFFILNRSVFREKSDNGQLATSKLFLISGPLSNPDNKNICKIYQWDNDVCVSPCLTKFRDNYLLMYLDTDAFVNDVFNGLYVKSFSDLSLIGSSGTWTRIDVNSDIYLPWHMSLFSYQDRLYAIVSCLIKGGVRKVWQMMGEFDDNLTSLKIFQRPLTDFSSYRGSALVTNEGEFILYSTTINENCLGGKSVDGREIIMTHLPFSELYNRISIK